MSAGRALDPVEARVGQARCGFGGRQFLIRTDRKSGADRFPVLTVPCRAC